MRSDKYLNNIDNEETIKETKKEEEKKEFDLSKIKKIIIVLTTFIIIIYILARYLFPNIITIKESKVESYLIPNEFNGFKIVQISDIHYGTNINKDKLDDIVKKVNELKPDIIFFTGDLFDKDISYSEENKKDIIDSLSTLEAKLYKYAISGNEDVNENDFYTIIDDAGFILLDNKAKILFNNGNTPIVIAGFSATDDNPDYNILENEEYSSYYKIALIHEPDEADNLENANLIFSGHSLGGIINITIPLINYKGAKHYKDFENHINDNCTLFISNGLGTNKLNLRFPNNPHINLYRLYSKAEEN